MQLDIKQLLASQHRYTIRAVIDNCFRHVDGVDFPMRCIALDTENPQYVNIKAYPHAAMTEQRRYLLRREAMVQSQTYHPYIAEFVEVFNLEGHTLFVSEDPTGHRLDEVMNTTRLETTFARIKFDNLRHHHATVKECDGQGLSEDQIRPIVHSILSALNQLSHHNRAHRLIGPETIVVHKTGRYAKLENFEMARFHSTQAQTFVGCSFFMAPEIWLRDPLIWPLDQATFQAHRYHSELSEVYAMGCVICYMRFSLCPFATHLVGIDFPELGNTVVANQACFLEQSSLSRDLRHLLNRMLKNNPAERLTVADALNHRWFRNGPVSPAPHFHYGPRQTMEEIDSVIDEAGQGPGH